MPIDPLDPQIPQDHHMGVIQCQLEIFLFAWPLVALGLEIVKLQVVHHLLQGAGFIYTHTLLLIFVYYYNGLCY